MSAPETFHVLLAEDNADDVLLMRQAFRKAGSPSLLHAVADGVEALAYLRGEGDFSDRTLHPWPDAILIDLNMPRLNGLEFLQ